MGKTYESDSFLMGTASGVHLARTVRRLPIQDQADGDILATIQGTPWDRKIGQIGRPKREAPPQVVAPPSAAEDKKEPKQQATTKTEAEEEKPEQKDVTVDAGLATGSDDQPTWRKLDVETPVKAVGKRKAEDTTEESDEFSPLVQQPMGDADVRPGGRTREAQESPLTETKPDKKDARVCEDIDPDTVGAIEGFTLDEGYEGAHLTPTLISIGT